MTKLKNPWLWLHGLVSGTIGGAATSGSALVGGLIAEKAGVTDTSLNLKQLGIILVSGAIVSALAYLKKSPLPELEEIDTAFITKQNNEE